MRFATVLLMLTSFGQMADADDAKQSPQEPVILSPEKQIDKAIAEYRELLKDRSQPGLTPASLEIKLKVVESKRREIIEMHKSLGVAKNHAVYEKAKADRIKIGFELERYYRLPANRPVSLVIEIGVATLLEELNTPLPPFDKKKQRELDKAKGTSQVG